MKITKKLFQWIAYQEPNVYLMMLFNLFIPFLIVGEISPSEG